jgi:hypothetical protein
MNTPQSILPTEIRKGFRIFSYYILHTIIINAERGFVSGFSGSRGTALLTNAKAFLLTDGYSFFVNNLIYNLSVIADILIKQPFS